MNHNFDLINYVAEQKKKGAPHSWNATKSLANVYLLNAIHDAIWLLIKRLKFLKFSHLVLISKRIVEMIDNFQWAEQLLTVEYKHLKWIVMPMFHRSHKPDVVTVKKILIITLSLSISQFIICVFSVWVFNKIWL